jgi:hypothetical protein
VATSAVVNELWEQLLAQMKEMDSREGTITVWEDGLAASVRALGRARMEYDAKCAQAEATQQDCLTRMHAFTSNAMYFINFNQMLEECQIILSL